MANRLIQIDKLIASGNHSLFEEYNTILEEMDVLNKKIGMPELFLDKSNMLMIYENLIKNGYHDLTRDRDILKSEVESIAGNKLLKLELDKLLLRLEQINILMTSGDKTLKKERDAILKRLDEIKEKYGSQQRDFGSYPGYNYKVSRCARNLINFLQKNPDIIRATIENKEDLRDLMKLLYENDEFLKFVRDYFSEANLPEMNIEEKIGILTELIFDQISKSSCRINVNHALQIIRQYINSTL